MTENRLNSVDIARVETKCDANTNSINELKRGTEREFTEVKSEIALIHQKTDAIHDLALNISVMTQNLTNIKEDIVDIKTTGAATSAKVAELETRDAKKAEGIIKTIKTAALTAIVTLVATGVGSAILKLLL